MALSAGIRPTTLHAYIQSVTLFMPRISAMLIEHAGLPSSASHCILVNS